MKKWANILGKSITIIALIFLIRRLISMPIDYSIFKQKINLTCVLGLSIACSFILSLTMLPWKILLEIFSMQRLKYIDILDVWLRSNILKYVPGNVFQYIAKNEIAFYTPVSQMQVAMATLADLFLSALIAVIFSILTLKNIILTIHLKISNVFIIAILSVTILIVFSFFIYGKKKGLNKFKYLLNKKNLGKFCFCAFFYFLFFIFYCYTYLVLLNIVFGVSHEVLSNTKISGAFVFSWVSGFVTPGAPGGIGVREYVMTLIGQGLLENEILILSMIIFRVITTFSDIILFLIGKCVYIYKNRNTFR